VAAELRQFISVVSKIIFLSSTCLLYVAFPSRPDPWEKTYMLDATVRGVKASFFSSDTNRGPEKSSQHGNRIFIISQIGTLIFQKMFSFDHELWKGLVNA
jgi:hypothetical protein